MGTFYDGRIYGIGWEIYDENGFFIQEFEQNDVREMTPKDVQDVKTQYDQLTKHEKHHAKFYFLTSCQVAIDCKNIYGFGSETKIVKFPIKHCQLVQFFEKGYVPMFV